MKPIKKDYVPTWKEYFMQIALNASERVHCVWVNIGVTIARLHTEKPMVLSTGYNGPVRGADHCDKVGCNNRDDQGNKIKGKFCRGSHAEMNAIVNAADVGLSIKGSTIFTTLSPCLDCAKHIVNSVGIEDVIYLEKYSKVFKGKDKEADRAIQFLNDRNKGCIKFEGRLVVRNEKGGYELKTF